MQSSTNKFRSMRNVTLFYCSQTMFILSHHSDSWQKLISVNIRFQRFPEPPCGLEPAGQTLESRTESIRFTSEMIPEAPTHEGDVDHRREGSLSE